MSSVSGANPNLSAQIIQQSQENNVAQVQTDLETSVLQGQISLQNEGRSIDLETMAISKDMVKIKQKLASEDHRQVMQQGKDGKVPEIIEALLALLSLDNLEKKKRKKKTSFDEKMEELEALEQLIDVKQLDTQDQQTFEKMMTNMTTIKRLKGKLNQVEAQEEHMEEQLRKQFPDAKGELPPDFETSPEEPQEPQLELPQ